MDLSQLHFAYPLWLWAGIVIPLMWILFLLFVRSHQPIHQLEKFIDSHLLPYLLVHSEKKTSLWKPLLLWSTVWLGLTLALAGPRWDFREMETFSRDQRLVILLDLSKSMTATDIKPSRLGRAKQKIEDLMNASQGIKIGLIAFAADPHMITPITEDKETIRHLLAPLENDLVHVQGSRLSSALNMASTMFKAEVGNNQAILIISDGGFEDASAITTAKKLADKGIVIYTMGVGTAQGAPLRDFQGNTIKKNGAAIISKLEKEKLSEISKIGNGRYLTTDYSDHSESILLGDLEKRSDIQLNSSQKNRFWNEHFYLVLFPILPIVLWWFRRGALITITLFFFTAPVEMEATISDYFFNSEERAKQAFDDSDYETACRSFQDPYRRGVSYYKAGNFSEAEAMFRQSSRPDLALNAGYNLGNTLAQQQKFEEAIIAYEEVLKQCPEHIKAKENLALIKKMKEEQKQDPSQSDKPKDQKENDKNNNDSDKQNKGSDQNSKDNQDQKDPSNQQNDSQQNQNNQTSDQQKNSPQNDEQMNNSGSDQDQSSQSQENQDKNEPGSPKGSDQEKEETSSHQQESKESQDQEWQNSQDNRSEAEKEEHANEKANETDQSQKGSDTNESAERDLKGKPEESETKSQEDLDADLWLDQIKNDPKVFLKNKFYLESKRNGTTQGIDPW